MLGVSIDSGVIILYMMYSSLSASSVVSVFVSMVSVLNAFPISYGARAIVVESFMSSMAFSPCRLTSVMIALASSTVFNVLLGSFLWLRLLLLRVFFQVLWLLLLLGLGVLFELLVVLPL